MTDRSPNRYDQGNTELISWLLESDEPWTRYRTLVDLLDQPEYGAEVQSARVEMLAHSEVQALITETTTWGERPLSRHNDASHPIYKFSTLADFGLRADDPGISDSIEAVMAHQSPQGAFQSVLNIHERYGGSGKDTWTWLLCDAPTLLYSLLAFGLGNDPSVQRAVEHLVSLVGENGWRCAGGPEVGKFRGPGRRDDPCPIVNVYALKVLAEVPDLSDSPATRIGTEMLFDHWACQGERRMYLFGIGTDYRKLKYPFVWYDVLHVVEVLSHYPFVHGDSRFREMVGAITSQADDEGRYTATSMYRAWKGWSFADKKNPSPWLTFLVLRVLKRIGSASEAGGGEGRW
jgi:hypothetical protein